ncbi:MAG TPA: SMP-30/gluconolactonase/LRE family protein [Gaiellaceae bacterium]|nr:SMP-30/gluconolactonase/LRE family protein [Gaiellaceae bacterium]
MTPNVDFDMSTLHTVATGLRFPEGPVALDDGTVLVPEIEGAALARVAPDGAVTRIHVGGGANGAALGPDGAVYVDNSGGFTFGTDDDGIRGPVGGKEGNPGGTVQRVDLDTGEVADVLTHVDGERLGGLNDIVFDETGSCYVVDTGRGEIHYADVIARTIRTVASGLTLPNGMGLSPSGDRLYVNETYVGNVDVWDVVAPGELADQRVLFNDGGEHGFDGLAVDGAGNVCAANLAASGVSVISPDGEEIARFATPVRDTYITNLCFGGPDGDTAYIASAGRGILYAIRWPWGGLRLHCAR